MTSSDPRRAVPAVGALLEAPLIRAMTATIPRTVLAEAARRVTDRARSDPRGMPSDDSAWASAVAAEADRLQLPTLRPLFNATGVVLHTNLGRAPLPAAAVAAIQRTAAGACNLEFDLGTGARGSRYTHCAALLCELTGAEDALVVNNCAAALVLALHTLARGCRVLVSRGELIEIGGSFRVPDIMAQSGVTIQEVGTTNRTHLDDYEIASAGDIAAIVKVHRSNFEMSGFVAEATLRDLAGLAQRHDIPLIHDFGSGLLLSLEPFGLAGEPTARDVVREGATITLMSGDKLLGGPQAGIMLGTRTAISTCRSNPLTRAFRVDKLTIAALSATLALYRDPARAVREVPTLAMATASPTSLRDRADALATRLAARGIPCSTVATTGSVGGGAFPSARLPSWAVALGGDANSMERKLRHGRTPVIGRIAGERVLIELRSIPVGSDAELADAVLYALSEHD